MEFLNNLGRIFIYNSEAPLIFNSGQFLLLFIVFLLIYNLIYKRHNLTALYVTLFSFFFYYKSSGIYVLILLATTIFDYWIGKKLAEETRNLHKKLWLTVGVFSGLALLAYFKYTNFLIFNIQKIWETNIGFQEIFLPIGISFYTFQSISYLIDIYKGKVSPAKSFIDFAFYLTFFPQLVAGPIVKANLFLPQLESVPSVDKTKAYSGLWLIIMGLVKKAVIADYISQYNDLVFAAPQTYSGFENLMAVLGYALQIFCDFSGYSDMAIGIGLVLGYDLGVNFLSPYKSITITEFWRRWHISLSSWLKEYLYIPLGGNREVSTFSVFAIPVLIILTAALYCGISCHTALVTVVSILGLIAYKTNKQVLTIITLASATISTVSLFMNHFWLVGAIMTICIAVWLIVIAFPQSVKSVRTNINLMLTMLIGGLWHGASWKFVLWGGAHGVALGIDKIVQKFLPQNTLTKFLSWLCTFVLVVFLWMFFRAGDITVDVDGQEQIVDAFEVPFIMLKQIFNDFNWAFVPHFVDARLLWLILVAFGYICHAIPENFAAKLKNIFIDSHIIIKAIILIVVIQVVVQLQNETVQPFIYFQF